MGLSDTQSLAQVGAGREADKLASLFILLSSLLRKTTLLVVDVGAFFLALSLAVWTRLALEQIYPHVFPIFYQNLSDYLQLWWLPVLLISLLAYEGLYTYKRFFWEELRAILKTLILYTLLFLTILTLGKVSARYSRTVLVLHSLYLGFLLPFLRYILLRLLHKLSLAQEKVLFWGDDEDFSQFHKYCLADPYLGLSLDRRFSSHEEPSVQDLSGRVVFVSTSLPQVEDKVVWLLTKIPRLYLQGGLRFRRCIFANSRLHIPLGGDTMFLEVENKLSKWHNQLLKRGLDLVVSLVLLPFVVPFLLVIALCMRKPFFGQRRIGKNEREFICWKVRTMYENSDAILEEYLQQHPEKRGEWERFRKLRDYDPRITPLGRLLRKTSLDELPQIWNVLKGEMSLVGPRPYMWSEKEIMGPYYDFIVLTKPGITGLWQVSGRNNLPFQSRLELDMWYVLNWSLWLDVTILIRTVKTVLWREGAC